MDKGVIILSDGTANALGVLKSLNIAKIPNILVTTNTMNCALYSKYSKKYVFPDPFKKSKEYIDKVLSLSEKYENWILMPTSDTAVQTVSQNKQALEEKFIVPVPDWEILEKCVKKDKMYIIADNINIPTPITYKLENHDQLKNLSYEMDYPCIIKGSSQRERQYLHKKVLEIKTKEELLEYGEKLLTQKIYPIIQEKIPGPPTNLIALASIIDKDYKPATIFVVNKIRQIPYTYGVGTLTESTWNSTIVKQGLAFLRAVKYTGISHIEFKYDPRDGRYKLIEINPRSWLHILLPTYCGLNFPKILYDLAIGEKHYPTAYRTGIKWHYIPSDILLIISQIVSKDNYFSFSKVITSMKGRRVFATLSLHDPGPFIQDLRKILRTYTRV
jgi:predicted ATP-grasp superfamily ATP-dependent carboligase